MDTEQKVMIDNPCLRPEGDQKKGSFHIGRQLIQWSWSTSGWWQTTIQGYRNVHWFAFGHYAPLKVEQGQTLLKVMHLIVGPLSISWGKV